MAEEMPIADAADHPQRSPSYLYKLIRDGRLPKIVKKGALVLRRKDVERVCDALAQRKSLRQQRKKLELSGRTASAARKAAYRAFGPIPRI
jgi:hypothetical protein